MALRQIRVMDDPILFKKSKPVASISPRTKELIDDMLDTMHDADGCGLAAVQVGVLKRIVVVEAEPENTYVLINPEIVFKEGEQTGYEGCLSVPGKSGLVTRPETISVHALDRDMKEFDLKAEGLLARAICHECDHLDGNLYVDLVEGELIDNSELEKMNASDEDTDTKQDDKT